VLTDFLEAGFTPGRPEVDDHRPFAKGFVEIDGFPGGGFQGPVGGFFQGQRGAEGDREKKCQKQGAGGHTEGRGREDPSRHFRSLFPAVEPGRSCPEIG